MDSETAEGVVYYRERRRSRLWATSPWGPWDPWSSVKELNKTHAPWFKEWMKKTNWTDIQIIRDTLIWHCQKVPDPELM